MLNKWSVASQQLSCYSSSNMVCGVCMYVTQTFCKSTSLEPHTSFYLDMTLPHNTEDIKVLLQLADVLTSCNHWLVMNYFTLFLIKAVSSVLHRIYSYIAHRKTCTVDQVELDPRTMKPLRPIYIPCMASSS